MKIVLLLLSSAMLAVLCYAAFRENVTEFYDYFGEEAILHGDAKSASIDLNSRIQMLDF